MAQRQVGERQVKLAVLEQPEEVGSGALLPHADADLRPLLAEAPDERGEEARADALVDADAERSRRAFRERGHVRAGRVEARNDRVGVAEQQQPGLGRLNAPRAAGTLRVGIYQSVGARLLPALVRRFRSQWPLVGVRVREESAAEDLLRLLEHGELDLTFADLPLREGPFEWAELLQDPYVLLVSAQSELASLDSAPSLREVAKLPLIGRRSTDEPERFLAGRAPDVNVVFRTDDNGTLAALVAEGLGAAIEPRLVVDPRNRDVKMLPFGNRIPPRRLAIVWHRDRFRSAAATAFVELSKEMTDTGTGSSRSARARSR